jgi:hypothetical protein
MFKQFKLDTSRHFKFKLFECITMNHRVSLDEVSEVSKFKLFECITMNHMVSLDEVSEVSKFKLFERITIHLDLPCDSL